MSILSRLSAALRQPADTAWIQPARSPTALELRQLPTFAVYRYGRPQWAPANVGTYVQTYEQTVVVFACVNFIADAAATAPVRLYDEADNNAELPDHPLRQLLRRPNPTMSESEFWNAMVKIAAVTGFAVAEKERSAAGRVVALNPLRSDWLAPIPRMDGKIDWLYQVPGAGAGAGRHELAAEDVFAWTYQGGPLIPAAGVPVLAAANREVGIENACTNFIKAFFDSGAVPQIGLVPQEGAELDQAEADTLREKFLQLGGANPWTPLVMQAIKEVVRLGFDLNEMAYKDLRNLTSTQIATAYRVPDVMLGTLAGLENSPWSKYEEARRSFYEDTITPLWSRLDGAVERQLLPDFETRPSVTVAFDTSEVPALSEDNTQTWVNVSNPGIQKILTVNEARGELGYPPIIGGDVRLLTVADIEVPATEEAQRQQALPLQARWSPLALPGGRAYRLPPAQRAAVHAGAKQTIVRLGDRGAPILRRFWREQGRRVLEEMGQGRSLHHSGSVNGHAMRQGEHILDWDEENRRLATALSPIYHAGGKAAFHSASQLLDVGLDWDVAHPQVGRVMGALLKRADLINETTRQDLAQLITGSLQEGISTSDLAARISAQFEDYGAGRASTTARTESQIAFNTGSRVAYQLSGVVEAAELLDNPLHGDYPGDDDGLTCAERDGRIVPLSQVDFHATGTHPNCVLAVSPVLSTPLGEADES